ncbi:hypothetical protein SAMN04489761_3522 [Tenacibaculum sp. MAR_2009_124]|uniref:hypothetical protein n=1 Tax=Tenacibaculum sp. MAR_2009_124 TaxID=1250059 RepID=UPI0008998F40|nr:hypothetical protein [Tenacibaculum sp. MAR_2009_124]SEC76863.1 hypothetical protein SAMN04489761_3522 [Tenacibaculum sp. MAR_2009_124]
MKLLAFVYLLLMLFSCKKTKTETSFETKKNIKNKTELSEFKSQKKPKKLVLSKELDSLVLIEQTNSYVSGLLNNSSEELPFEEDDNFKIVSKKVYKLDHRLFVCCIKGLFLPSEAEFCFVFVLNNNKVIEREFYTSEVDLIIELLEYELFDGRLIIKGKFHEFIGGDENTQNDLVTLIDTPLLDI